MKARAKKNARPESSSAGRMVSPARRAAFEILRRVEDEGAFASVLLAAADFEKLRAEDRALCHELVLGVLRWQLRLDALIEHYAGGRKAESLDKPVRRALRLGLYQLRHLTRIPASAIVNESVNLAYLARLRSAAGFINAVLRRAARESDFDPAATIEDPLMRLSVETSHPTWLLERWARAFGFAETGEFARSNNEAPPVAFRLTGKGKAEQKIFERLTGAGAVIHPSAIAPDGWRASGAGAVLRELAREGHIYLQDEASQLVAHLLDAASHERVLDVCAAPGSKTTHLAALAKDALIVAGDIYEHRLQSVLEAQKRAGIENIKLAAYDATRALPFAEQSFNRVLVDAPCTGTGTLRRNPEIRWRILHADVLELAARQKLILANAAKMVAGGGRLVYSTCSVEPEENEEVAAGFLRNHADFKPVSISVKGLAASAQSSLRTWPHREGADGFFIAAFEKI